MNLDREDWMLAGLTLIGMGLAYAGDGWWGLVATLAAFGLGYLTA